MVDVDIELVVDLLEVIDPARPIVTSVVGKRRIVAPRAASSADTAVERVPGIEAELVVVHPVEVAEVVVPIAGPNPKVRL